MDYEVGDAWPCPACSKDVDGTPTVAEVDGEFVKGEHCGSWWHGETRMAKEVYEASQVVSGSFGSGENTASAGDFVADPAKVLSLSTESDGLLESLKEVQYLTKLRS